MLCACACVYAEQSIGESTAGLNRFRKATNKVRVGVRLASGARRGGGDSHDSDGRGQQHRSSSSRSLDDMWTSSIDSGSNSRQRSTEDSNAGGAVGGAWAQVVGAFFAHDKEAAGRFDAFRKTYHEQVRCCTTR
jgi:hypothetical protein